MRRWKPVAGSVSGIDERRHVGLPAGVGVTVRHRRPERVEVGHLEVAEQVLAVEEDRVVGRPGGGQVGEQLGPDRRVAAHVLGLRAREQAHPESDPFHRGSGSGW